MPPRPPSSRTDDAVVLVVDDWGATFHVPDDDGLRRPGRPWLVPAAGAAGVLLSVMLMTVGAERESTTLYEAVTVVGFGLFLGAWGALALGLGGVPGKSTAVAVATLGWLPAFAMVLTRADLDGRLVLAVLVLAAAGQAVADRRVRRQATREREMVAAARRGGRFEGWVVAADGPPWSRELRIEPSTADGVAWTGEHSDWRAVRPRIGHPVGIWRPEPPGTAVVLLPRDPR